ncbi:unnamed protein product [Amoebophrya sp. A120]|nr:unnamed protein product [Amoebophrya sp. A120]|eukprot:GSA120T00007872001.1
MQRACLSHFCSSTTARGATVASSGYLLHSTTSSAAFAGRRDFVRPGEVFHLQRDQLTASTSSSSSRRCAASRSNFQQLRTTTILCVRKDNKVVMCGDGLVTAGHYKVKPNALKVRTVGKGKNLCITGFAGGTADCLALLERLEMKLEEYPGQLVRASVELAKAWRLDKMLRQLNATVVVANAEATLELTGNGDCFEPHDGVLGIGSGGAFATAAARALMEAGVALSAREIGLRAMQIAADLDTATNSRFTVEEIDIEENSTTAASAENEPSVIGVPKLNQKKDVTSAPSVHDNQMVQEEVEGKMEEKGSDSGSGSTPAAPPEKPKDEGK